MNTARGTDRGSQITKGARNTRVSPEGGQTKQLVTAVKRACKGQGRSRCPLCLLHTLETCTASSGCTTKRKDHMHRRCECSSGFNWIASHEYCTKGWPESYCILSHVWKPGLSEESCKWSRTLATWCAFVRTREAIASPKVPPDDSETHHNSHACAVVQSPRFPKPPSRRYTTRTRLSSVWTPVRLHIATATGHLLV